MKQIEKPQPSLTGLMRSDRAAERTGKQFVLGTPYIHSNGLYYTYPKGDTKEFECTFKSWKDEIGAFLLRQSKTYINEFAVRVEPAWPHLQNGERGLVVHLGGGGRWVEFGLGFGGVIADLHNMDAFDEQILGFNLASDLLEKVEADIRAPRITAKYDIVYALPFGLMSLPIHNNPIFSENWVDKWSERVAKLGSVRISISEEGQEFAFKAGKIIVKDGECRGEGFTGFSIPGATTLIAKLVDSCSFSN